MLTTTDTDETDSLRAENARLRVQLAEVEALRTREAEVRVHNDRTQVALSAGAIIGTWNWHPMEDRFIVDEAFAHTFGHSPDVAQTELSIAQVLQNVHPDDLPTLNVKIEEALVRGGAYAHQYRVRRADGKYYWIEANGRVHYGPDGSPLNFPGVIINVDERHRLEAERDRATAALRNLTDTLEQQVAERTAALMKAEEALRQSHKMEAVGQLTGGLAHDFNNLLAGISGSLEMMQSRIQQGRYADVDRYLVSAQGAAKRAAALTHRLLAFSRRQTLAPKPTDVNQLVEGMRDLIQRTVGPTVPMKVVAASDLWPVLVDPSQLENALLNLCINARDAMPDGGRIVVRTANQSFDEQEAKVRGVAEGRYISLCVTDTGTGMPPDVVAKAFEPFFTTKPIGAGTGLGLSMIYGFAQQSGGQVRIDSTVGEGTTVCILLPRHAGEACAPDEVSARHSAQPCAEHSGTVLVVDDEPAVRMLVTDILNELGFRTLEAGDSTAGLDVLLSDARIDLLITDVGLPGGLNGRQMADAARVSRPDLKVLFITGYAETVILGDKGLGPGMDILTKPFAIESMTRRIRSIIEQDAAASEATD